MRLREFLFRVRAVFGRRYMDADLGDEIHSHLDLLADEHVRRGMSLHEARAAARRDFGGVVRIAEQYRDQRGLPFFETLAQDLGFGWRLLYRAPGFTAAAVLILALGIGATVGIFSLVDAALIRPLPYRDPERLVAVWERSPRFARGRVAPLDFLEWTEQSRSFASMAAATGGGSVVVTASGAPENIPTISVTPAFFDVFGVVPIVGRTFLEDDATRGRNVAVVSERAWRSRFGSDPGLVGRSLTVSGAAQPFTIVGIVPAGFRALTPADIWFLFGPISRGDGLFGGRRNHFLQVVARLKPDVTLQQARADMSSVAANIAREAPDTNRDTGATVDPLRQSIVGDDLRTTTLVLAFVVAFILLLACANVANLLLARGISRTREVAVRAALGGGRWRIVRQLLTENALLSACGGAAGLLLAWTIVHLAPALVPPGTIPEGIEVNLDMRLVAFAAAITCATSLLAGLIPTWRATRVTLAEVMTAGGRSATEHTGVIRHALTVVEVAAALLLATGAGLLVRTLISLDRVDGGYRADRVVTMQVFIELQRYPTHESRTAFYQALQDEISRLPGVRLVAQGFDVPFDGSGSLSPFAVVGGDAVDPARRPSAHYQMVSPRYFETLGIPLVRGRVFVDRDAAASTPVCIVNEEFVRRYLADRDPIGARIGVQTLALMPAVVTREVVGVVRQVKERPDARDDQVEIYVPQSQNSWFNSTIVVRADQSPTSLVPALRAAAGRVRADLAASTRIRTMEEVATQSTATQRFRARLVGAFAALAILLAAAGVFSVFTFSVQQRTREFSIRLALGARGQDVLTLVLASGTKVVAIGLVLGIAAALLLVRSMASLLFAVTPFDPLTFVSASVLLAVVALTACMLPAIRAARSDPAVALRHE